MPTGEHFDAFTRVVERTCQPMRCAAFGIGWVVRSRRGSFRGVVVNVDAAYLRDPDWLAECAADPELGADQPWYTIIGEDDDGRPSRAALLRRGDTGAR